MKPPTAQHRFCTYLLLCMIALALSACGFALRGSSGDFKLPFKTLYVNVPDTDYLGATLKRNIKSTGTEVVKDKKQAEALLEILEQTRTKDILSLNTAGRVREYALFYTFSFRVINNENYILMDPVKIRLRRTLTYSESQALSKEGEEEMLYKDMENDVIQQVIRRLAILKIDPEMRVSGDKEPD